MFEIRKLNIGDHSPLEATYEASFESGDFGWDSIACKDDLTTSLIERIERVEELFLGCFLSLQKLYIVNEQQITFAIATPEVLHRTILDRSNHLIGELLCSDEGDPCFWVSAKHLMCNSLHEMSLSQTGIAIQEKGIVDLSWCLRNSQSSCGCELI